MDREIEQAFTPKKTDEDKKDDRIETGDRLVDVINEHEFIHWDQLITFLRNEDDKELRDYVYNHAYLVQCLLLDCYHKLGRNEEK